MSKRTIGWLTLVGFLATIPIANAWLQHFGMWHVPTLGPVASGVVWVGLAFVLRDVAQLTLGRTWAYGAILVGALLSWWLASPALAVASGAAFACSEALDAAIYTPLAKRRFLRAVALSGWAGSLLDSAIFVRLAFHSYSGWWQLGLVKAAVVAVAAPVAYSVRQWVRGSDDGGGSMKVYLAGPINGCTDDEASGWREGFIAQLDAEGIDSLDPMVRDYRGREDECVGEIVTGDKLDIRTADVFLAYCWQVSWGTAMEILYAYSFGKVVLLVMPEGARISPWLRYHADAIVPTLADALGDLRGLNRYGIKPRPERHQ